MDLVAPWAPAAEKSVSLQISQQRKERGPAPGTEPGLAGLLTLLGNAADRGDAAGLGVRWTAEAVKARLCVLIDERVVVAAHGLGDCMLPSAELAVLAEAAERELAHISLPGMGAVDLAAVRVPGEPETRLVVAGPHADGFGLNERALLAGAARALGLGLRAARAIEQERGLRRRGQREARQRLRAERELAHQALHDRLTALPNRHLMRERTVHALERCQDGGGCVVAMLVIDLDHFKFANDALDHRRGDRLLLLIADRLAQLFGSGSDGGGFMLGRHGGDEFIVLCEELDSEHEAVIIAQRIQEALRAPFILEDRHISMTASIGIAFAARSPFEDPQTAADGLLRDADVALNRAKESGRNRYELFDECMRRRLLERVALEADLRTALERDQLRLIYQPMVGVDDGRLVAVEALLRWEHPERGTLVPAQFIPMAEESDLIVTVGRWVIGQACEQIARWRQSHSPTGLRVSVNVSARQLTPVLVETVGSALLNSGVPAELLALEITESVLIDHAEGAGQVLAELKSLGVRLVLDDFGTGYSSLSYLNEFPLDSLKIDRSFTSELTNGPRGAKIVAATIEMARALGMTVIAEGVETQEQLDVLRKLGCQYAQGYLFAPAQPPAEVLAHMRARQPPVPDGGPRWAVRRGAKVPLRRLSDLGAEQARRRHQRALGQMAAWVFLAGTLVAAGGEVALGASTGATTALLALLGLASATLCFVVPWDRLAPDWLHLMPALATVEVTVWALAAGRHGSVVEAFYLLIGTAVAYAFIDRRLIAAQVTLIAAAMLLPAVLTSHRGYDGVAQTAVTILVLAVTVALVVYLRERMEASTAELRELAARDPLTDVGNYRLLHERLEYELVRHTRERQPLAVLLVDLDHFKQVNERFGHAAGDEVLRRVGRALRDAVRQQDTVARPGGDEFAVLAPGTDADGALLLSDRIGERLSEIELGHVSVGATVGYAVFPHDGTTAPALLGQADEVLMARKRDRPTPRAAPESSLPAAAPQPRFV